jgi:nicotinamidase-related amidase
VENNYRTVLIEDACRGVNERAIEVKRAELNEVGSIFVDSDVVSERKQTVAHTFPSTPRLGTRHGRWR